MEELLYSRQAAAGYLGLKHKGLRMTIWRGHVVEESPGLIAESELERYWIKYSRKKAEKYVPPPEGICRRCGQLDNAGLCEWCRRELETGRYIWYTM